ncbi:MAG: 4Fe-4S binding protein [Anaerolineae bacterium]|jgi:MauM/NapG family ferredoxin protein|nr:4Fe-4S binding protein [Chloroflexota bacterium]
MKAVRWLRPLVQAVAFGLATLAVLLTAVHPSSWFSATGLVSLDPLAVLAALLSARRFRLLPALAVVALTLVTGRAWCGWLCPLGSVLEWTSPVGNASPPARRWHGLKYGLLLFLLVSAALGSLSLLILDPITLFVRTVTVVLQPGLQWLIGSLQQLLYRYDWLAGVADLLDAGLRPALLAYKQPYWQHLWPVALLTVAVFAANRLAPRFWCRYLCPLGALLGLVSRVALFKRRVNNRCIACQRCARGCQMDAIDGAQAFASDAGECIQCLDCLAECPTDAIAITPHRSMDWGWEYDPGRRTVLGALGLGVASLALANASATVQQPQDSLLRPPGAGEASLQDACLRCGACLRACPTHGLQMSMLEGGWLVLGTPLLVPRLGHCEYGCNLCGSVCPTGAIPELSLEEKRRTPIGKAYVDATVCLAWSGRVPCIVCEEMCPLPQKAITLVEVPAQGGDMQGSIQAPVVNHGLCIGCGLCENRCPTVGSAAIRVRLDPLS